MDTILVLLGSMEFWTILGSLAAVAGVWLALRHNRSARSALEPAPSSTLLPNRGVGADVEELDTEQHWVEAQVTAIREARWSISLCLHTIHSSAESWKAERVNAALKEALARGLEIRVLAATNPERLQGGYELEFSMGVDVRFAPEIRHYDLRFLKADGQIVVLGIAEPDLEYGNYRPSRSWTVLRSAALCEALERDFQRMWLSPNSVSFSRWCADTLRHVESVPPARIAADLGLEYEVVQQLAKQQSMLSVVGDRALVFYGKSSSGKSTIMRRFGREHGARFLDFRDLLLPHIERQGVDHIDGTVTRTTCTEALQYCEIDDYDLIESCIQCEDDFLPKLFSCISAKERQPVLVLLDVPVSVAMQRNAHRTIPVSPNSILEQAELETTDAVIKLCAAAQVPVIRIDAARNIEQCYQDVKRHLREPLQPRSAKA